jgi:hypothetical protein
MSTVIISDKSAHFFLHRKVPMISILKCVLISPSKKSGIKVIKCMFWLYGMVNNT